MATAHAEALEIVVDIRDYSGAPEGVLREARKDIARLFTSLDVRIEWRAHAAAPDGVSDRPTFTVAILSPAMVERKSAEGGFDATVLATSVMPAGRAYIFYHRIVAKAEGNGVHPATLLARAISHELGHLAGLDHNDLGIMRRRAELVPGGFQQFTPAQGRAIRRALALRSAALQIRRPAEGQPKGR